MVQVPSPSRERQLGFLAVALGSFLLSPAAAVPTRRQESSPSWQKYVRASSNTTITPVSVLSTTGDVKDPNNILTPDGTVTILNRLYPGNAVPCVTVDFGQNTVGLLNINFAGAKVSPETNNTPGYPSLQLAFSETKEYLLNRSDFTRSDDAYEGSPQLRVYDGVDQIAVKPQAYNWTDQNGCEYGSKVCSDGLHGFRYVKICLNDTPVGVPYSAAPYTSPYGRVSISAVDLTYSGFLGTPDTFTGWFECSDTTLTQWWYDGVYTLDMGTDVFRANDTEPRNAFSDELNGEQVILDGAKRDRDPYVGDIAVSGLTSYLSHNLSQVVVNVLKDLIDHQQTSSDKYPGFIPPASIVNYRLYLLDYPLWWVKCVYDLVLYTGNTGFATTYFSNLVSALDDFYLSQTNASSQLVSRSEDFGDYAFTSRNGTVTYYNALYVLALNQAAFLATLVGQTAAATRWQSRADTVAKALRAYSWDANARAFFDGTPCGAQLCNTHSQDSNSLAVLAGVVNGTEATSVLNFLASALRRDWGNAFFDNGLLDADYSTRVYAFLSYFEIEARLSTSRATAPSGWEELRRLYGVMARGDPGVTFWEGIGEGGTPYEEGFTSMAHGWSTGVVPLLTNHLLGVTPTRAGFSSWRVRPVVDGSGVTWARGQVPTPKGAPVMVSWTANPGGGESFSIQVSAPQGTVGLISVPVNGSDTGVTVDGTKAFDVATGQAQGFNATVEDGYVSVQVNGGSHTVAVTGGS